MRRAAATAACTQCRSSGVVKVAYTPGWQPIVTRSGVIPHFRFPRMHCTTGSTTEGSTDSTKTEKASAPVPAAAETPAHFKLVLPDMGQATKTGNILAWRCKEGDFVKNGQVVCELETDQCTVGMEIADKGWLARILVPQGTKDIPCGETLALLAYKEEHKDSFKDVPTYRPVAHVEGGKAQEESGLKDKSTAAEVDGVHVLKLIHHLIKQGSISDQEFAKKLQALARQENAELLRVYKASYEGEVGRQEDFDLDFFLDNARGITEAEHPSGH